MDDPRVLADLSLAAKGDAEALQLLLVRWHAVWCTRVAAGLTTSVHRHVDPEDILQEAYVRAFRSMASCTFATPSAFHAWLDQIVSNVLCDQHRLFRRKKRDIARERRSTIQHSDSRTQLFDRLCARDSTPSRVIARAETNAAVTSSLARLTEEQRQVICFRFLEGWPVRDIAAHMGRSEGAVHALCYRALRALRDALRSLSQHMESR